MPRLIRERDGEGFAGSAVDIIEWNEDGTFKKIHEDGMPRIGCSVKVGSVTAGTYSTRDWWMTTPVTEILEIIKNDKGQLEYIKFKTENSVYEMKA